MQLKLIITELSDTYSSVIKDLGSPEGGSQGLPERDSLDYVNVCKRLSPRQKIMDHIKWKAS